MTSTESAARFLAMYRGRGAHLPELMRHTWWQARQFREVVLEHVARLQPRPVSEIERRVRDDWGSVGRRRLERALARMVADGAIRRTPDGYLLARKR